jgi:hypothetical protein
MAVVLGLFLAGAAMAQAPTYQPVGTVRQIMLGIVKPTSDIIFSVPGKPPKTDEEWAAVQNAALMLAETGNLLMMPGRSKDNGEWMKNAKDLVSTSAAIFKFANAKDAKTLEDLGDKLDENCESCHGKYLPK